MQIKKTSCLWAPSRKLLPKISFHCTFISVTSNDEPAPEVSYLDFFESVGQTSKSCHFSLSDYFHTCHVVKSGKWPLIYDRLMACWFVNVVFLFLTDPIFLISKKTSALIKCNKLFKTERERVVRW